MRNVVKTCAAALSALLILTQVAQAERVAFVGCPVMRDIESPNYPCWLAEYQGELYYLGLQGDTVPPVAFYPPQLLHRVLVEADTVEGERICGGLPLANVSASVLPEIDRTCDTILPSAGFTPPTPLRQYAPFRAGFGARLAADPATIGAPALGLPAPPPPQPPFAEQTFRVDFFFMEDFMYLDDGFALNQAAGYFRGTNARRAIINVYLDRVRLTNGETMQEDWRVAERRAERVQSILEEWGVPADKIQIRLNRRPIEGGRYATVTVQP